MKRIIYTILLLLIPVILVAQTSVRTELSSNKYKTYKAAQANDTLYVSASSIVSGSLIPNYNMVGSLVGLAIGSPVADDTVTIKNGADTVYQLIQPASAPFIYNVKIDTRLDTSLIFSQKKTSRTTLIYRLRY
jgi:hypothetical protein